jgi:hypothetical protein
MGTFAPPLRARSLSADARVKRDKRTDATMDDHVARDLLFSKAVQVGSDRVQRQLSPIFLKRLHALDDRMRHW